MIQSQYQRYGAVYFQGNSIGVCIFDEKQYTINCGQILEYCYFDQQLVFQKLSSCSDIITNQSRNYLLKNLTHLLFQYKQNLLKNNIINQLSQLPVENQNNFMNKFHYFELMEEDSFLKFNALGLLLQRLTNYTSLLMKKGLYLENIEYWNDYIYQHVKVGQKEIRFLQIMNLQNHPSLVKVRPMNTQGNSIYKIFSSYLKSKGAKKYLQRLMLNPTYNSIMIEQRHQNISWMIKKMRDKKYYQKLFKNIYSIDSILQRCSKNKMRQQDWRKLMKTIQTFVQLRKVFPLNNLPSVIKNFIDDQNWTKVYNLLNLMRNAIQFSPFGVRDDYNQKLKSLKILKFKIPNLLEEYQKNQNWKTPGKLGFVSNLGFLVQVSHDSQMDQTDIQNWQLIFTNNKGKFFSNELTKALDQKFGDIQADIQDKQTQIIHQIQGQINDISDILINLFWKVSQIECFWGLSCLGINMSVPKLSSEELIIINGWNILLGQNGVENHYFSFNHEKGPKNQVSNSEVNIVNTNYSNRCCILTGPNGSGKTYLMKQIGTIFYLTHCGFFIPATLAQIPLLDRIEFIQSHSSFFSKQAGFNKELASLSKIINNQIVTSKTLVLIDELGLGVDFILALKLLYACVNHFSDNQNSLKRSKNKILLKSKDYFNVPITLIITHLTSLIANQLIKENYIVRFLKMDVNNQFKYLFKMKPGVVQSGYGIKSASAFLQEPNCIEDANYYWNRII